MDSLVEGQETGVQQHLSLEDPQSSLEWLPPSKTKGRTFTSSYEEEAAAIESALYWTFANAIQSSFNHYTVAQIADHYVKLSFQQILVPLQFAQFH